MQDAEGNAMLGEPNNYEAPPENCAGCNYTEVVRSGAWGWADSNCSRSSIFMCRMSGAQSAVLHAVCAQAGCWRLPLHLASSRHSLQNAAHAAQRAGASLFCSARAMHCLQQQQYQVQVPA
jgi:hypothetical protein